MLIIAGICVITASAALWRAGGLNDIPEGGHIMTPAPVIYVEAGTHLQYLPNFSARAVANSYVPSKATVIPYKTLSPLPSSQPVTTISIPSSGTSVIPANGYSPGYSGKVPVRPNTHESTEIPGFPTKTFCN